MSTEQPVVAEAHTAGGPATLPRLDEPAPAFEGLSTHGPVKLSDYLGRWLVFSAHPADFTPVCASELVAFARRASEFTALNCALLALSVDSVYSHLAWRESIRQKFGVVIEYPILEDVTMDIARRYGMVQTKAGHSSTVRALFVIDDRGVLRAMMLYPNTTGRSVEEVLRLVQALQVGDRLHAVTPEGWKPGQHVIDVPPDTVAAAEISHDASYGCVDWYYWTKPAAEA
ncbi:MAG TPA: peroxiredoxin [Steroidobacteraceae bacterium]|nr:peroxiredoxin [Steroidobacteraceae bacterium]